MTNDRKLTTLPYLHVLVHVKYLRNDEVMVSSVASFKMSGQFYYHFHNRNNLLMQNILEFMKVLKSE